MGGNGGLRYAEMILQQLQLGPRYLREFKLPKDIYATTSAKVISVPIAYV